MHDDRYKVTEEELRQVRNDSGQNAQQITERLGDGIDIEYGDLVLRAERHTVNLAREEIAEVTPGERVRLLSSIDRALRRNLPRVKKGKASKKLCDQTVDDVVLWYVLKGN
jgi:hypothetical protein